MFLASDIIFLKTGYIEFNVYVHINIEIPEKIYLL